MTTITQTISTLEPVPSRDDPDNFDAEADQFLGKLPQLRTELNAFAGQANTVAAEVNTNATAAGTAAANATAAAQAAAANAGAAKWVAGTNYAEGAAAWSPLDTLTYRRKVAGVSNTDPKLDAAGWAPQFKVFTAADILADLHALASSF